jgi:2-polyprenyl-3-methyl-5-hydroxy-6-metoxy-1,4-benzoquinol methylase
MAGVSVCPVCNASMHEGAADWCLACRACGFQQSSLRSCIGDHIASGNFDEQMRAIGLATLRKKNFERILDRLASLAGPSQRALLEVGCAHGWFLDAAARRGYAAAGIEPDAPVAALAMNNGHEVTIGYFPEALKDGTSYDFIVFNDVFEHLPNPGAALEACKLRLRPRGLLVLNLPSSRGIFFRVATLLARCGIRHPYERMWQKGFPSPHLTYFNPDALTKLAQRAGFKEVYRGTLNSLDHHGLWQRLRADQRGSLPGALLIWLVVTAAKPLFGWLPADIALQIYAIEAK